MLNVERSEIPPVPYFSGIAISGLNDELARNVPLCAAVGAKERGVRGVFLSKQENLSIQTSDFKPPCPALRGETSNFPVPHFAGKLQTLIFFLFLCSFQSQAQKLTFWDADTAYNKKRANTVAYTTAGAYAGAMTGLYFLWYADYPLSEFHFFNDNNEWLLIDKGGHLINSYWVGKMGIDVLKWTGMPRKKAIWIGGSVGLAFLTSVEIFDGFSEQWGFSNGDVIANTMGAATAISQELLWNEQRIEWKLSFRPTNYAQYRPDVFGTSFTEKVFKDYNGHTYWLSGNISSFLNSQSKFPKWLNISFGYGADGLTGGTENATEYNGNPIPSFKRVRQFYFAPDINLTRIKTKSKVLRFIFQATRFIKFPLPALEFNTNNKWVVHGLYF